MLHIFTIAALLATPAQAQWKCDPKKYCSRMESCAEAVYQLKRCGAKRRDGDKDGIPREKLCGKTKAAMARALGKNRKRE